MLQIDGLQRAADIVEGALSIVRRNSRPENHEPLCVV